MNEFLIVAILLLLFGRNFSEEYNEKFAREIYKNEKLRNYEHLDFRCSQNAYSLFTFSEYTFMYYDVERPGKIGCLNLAENGKLIFYPTLTALDPMFTFYINKVYEGIARVAQSPRFPFYLPYTAERRKKYCLDVRMIGSAFVEYIEIFPTDDETCRKMMEIAKECYIFRQVWNIWIKDLYERFCMDEDGCYKTMEFYEEDMPHCVKYIANRQFQNVSFGSWHHSIINYCQLTDMVPEAKNPKYDRSILFEDDKTEDDLRAMCQFLRFRLLPEEGKEEEIREITLEERGNIGADAVRDSAAPSSDRSTYVMLTILLAGI